MNRVEEPRTNSRSKAYQALGKLGRRSVLLALVSAVPAAAASLYMADNPDCRPAGFTELACGGLGSIYLGQSVPEEQKNSCTKTNFRLVTAQTYPGTAAEVLSSEGWHPCADGRCFTEKPQAPWVAVVDWNNPHGWSVGETILRSAADPVDVRLFPMDFVDHAAIDALPAAGDFHVLAQLCRIAERAAQGSPPSAVNLSFGRWARKGGRAACEADLGSGACLVSKLLAYLRQDLGILVFAAAGNEGELLFPAADRSALAVGSLDLTHFRRTGKARAIPQTPPEATGLFPGQGLYLEDRGGGNVWAAPPGSSYASAIAAGWWAGYQAKNPLLAEKAIEYCANSMLPSFDGGLLELGCGGVLLPESDLEGVSALFSSALGERPDLCMKEPRENALVEIVGPTPPPSEITLDEAQAELNRPAPDSRPCVPCHGTVDDDSGSNEGTSSQNTLLGSHGTASVWGKSDTGRLTIDLSRSQGFRTDLELLGLYLEVGDELYRFSDSENTTLLGEIALGEIHFLTIDNIPRRVDEEPVALVYAVRLAEFSRVLRSSTPVLYHRH